MKNGLIIIWKLYEIIEIDKGEMKVGRRNGKGLPYNNLEVTTNAKEHFLFLCNMYENMGKLIKLQSQTVSHPSFSKTTAPAILVNMTQQHHEMGEELKNIGAYLDLMPGKNVLRPEEPEGKEVEVEVEKEPPMMSGDFVSNIQPEEENNDNDTY